MVRPSGEKWTPVTAPSTIASGLGAESSVKLAERQMERIDELDLPGEVRAWWDESSAPLRVRVGRLRGE